MRLCSIEDCGNKHEAKGYCKSHYTRFRKYGDPLGESIPKEQIKRKHGKRKEYPTKRKSRIPYEDNHKIIDGIEHKLCSCCDNWFPMTREYFYRNKANSTDGFHPYCKECTKERSSKWQQENKEKISEMKAEWYKQNKEEALEKRRAYNDTHKERLRKYVKQYQKSEQNKEKFQIYRLKRKSKDHDISKEEWEYCKKYFDNSCAYCGLSEDEHKLMHRQQLHKEHVDHEGANDLSNCVPACRSCNSIKHTSNFEEWYNERNPVYSTERLEKIIKWLNVDFKLYMDTH